MSSFFAIKLDIDAFRIHADRMTLHATSPESPPVARCVRARIAAGGERVWQLADFQDQPFAAVAQTLSRLARAGEIQRLSKGVYYRPRQTPFGQSHPNPSHLQHLAGQRQPLFPAGIMAANLLGLTTQAARRGEVSTPAGSLPRKLVGADVVIHTRRPAAWAGLGMHDAAVLESLRRGGRDSDLPPDETTARLFDWLRQDDRLTRLLRVSGTEPPRVRAILGALGEQLGTSPALLAPLRASLNPLSRFDFGIFASLPHAARWQAKPARPHAPV
jgi:hypothetical protein